jgi:hypothetical protein
MTREQSYDVGILRHGQATELLDIANETYQPLQLSTDGKWLLVGTDGSLYDTDTMVSRPLATPGTSFQRTDNILAAGMDRASMSSNSQHFLYVLPANPSNAFEQLATVGFSPTSPGTEPLIKDARVDPTEITTDGATTANATVRAVWDGELIGIGLVPIYAGAVDPNLSTPTFTDTTAHDPDRGQGIFTAEGLAYAPRVVRDEDTGPRTLRAYVEVKTEDGRSHATAVDFATLTVIAPP